jgi:hypothetical protein
MLYDGLLPYARMTALDLSARALATRTGFVTLARQLSAMGVSPTFA